MNVDDHLNTAGGLNNAPDTHPSYEDRAYGGAGRDVLIANTGGDRLIDWTGEFNSYLVPFAPYGVATISRTQQPQLKEFLYALSASDGVDRTRVTDTGSDPARNGEPAREPLSGAATGLRLSGPDRGSRQPIGWEHCGWSLGCVANR